ncbi:MAG: tetratricopeptide repeat protein [Elusimicrobiaceae bacterium]|nr:tetratricopeptide repeat protein [Elusimicrobiaceae bacterium]
MKKIWLSICLLGCMPSFGLEISPQGAQEAQLFNTFLEAVYIHQNDPARAFETLKKALALQPESKYVQQLLVSAAVAMEKPELADPYVGFISQEENDAEAWSIYAAYQTQKNNPQEALKAYEKALEKNPEDTDLLYRYLLILSVTDIDKAISVLDKFAQTQPQAAAQAYTQIGRLYARQRKWETALAYLDRAIQADPEDPSPRLTKGEIYEETSQYFLMLHEFEELEKMGYGNAGSYSRMAAVFLLVKDIPKAKEYFLKAKQQDPADDASNYFLSLLSEEQKDYPQAIAYLQAAASYPTKAAWWLQVSFLQQKQNQAQESLRTLEEAYKRFDGNVEIGFFYGLSLNDSKQYKKAARVFEKVLQTNPDYTEARLHYAYALESLKKYKEMESQIQAVLASQPQNAPALNLLAYSLAQRDIRLEEAQEYATRALAVSPQDISFIDTMGWVYIKQNKLDEAEKIFAMLSDQTVAQYPEITYHVGALRFKQGRRSEALEYLKRAMKGWPAAEQLYKKLMREK